MKHKVPWNRTLLEDFIKEGLLTEDEEFIMRTRLAGLVSSKASNGKKYQHCYSI